jgi:hypothetical protein
LKIEKAATVQCYDGEPPGTTGIFCDQSIRTSFDEKTPPTQSKHVIESSRKSITDDRVKTNR